MTDAIQIENRARIRLISMTRPDRKNALTHAMYSSMAEAIDSAQHDPAVRVVAITGTGDAFTAGNDLQDFMASPPNLDAEEWPPVYKFLRAICHAEKPLAAIVNGVCVGVGTTMLLHCDFAYAARSAVFSAPFVDLGVVPEAGSSMLLPMLIGERRAAEILYLGDRMSADEAEATGLVTRTFDDDALVEEAWSRLERLAAKAPRAVRETKALLKKNRQDIEDLMIEEGRLFEAALRSAEFQEAAAAFMQKRPANFDRFE